MNTYEDVLNADRRLVILRLLAEQPGYKANSTVLAMLLDTWGHAVSRDYVKTQLAWLDEQDLVETQEMGTVILGTVTERGVEAAQGRIRVPGVARPGR